LPEIFRRDNVTLSGKSAARITGRATIIPLLAPALSKELLENAAIARVVWEA
jgi:hypothetical protein